MVCSAPPRRLGKWICVQLPECEVGVERAGKRPRTTSRSVHLFNRSVLSPGSPHGHGPAATWLKMNHNDRSESRCPPRSRSIWHVW